jgi:hypothetical protein
MATLTTVKGTQMTTIEGGTGSKLDAGQNYGVLRVLYGSYTVDAADEFGTDGLVRLFTIPAGARLIDCEVSMEATGATGIFDLGWAASPEVDPDTGSALEAADPDGIIQQVDPGAAAINRQKMPSTRPGYMKRFAGSVEVQADWTEVSADAGGDTLEVVAIIALD